MNSELKLFDFEGNQVRTLMKDGEWWWILADICRILDLGNTVRVKNRLDEDEKGITLIHTLGGAQKLIVINEFGLYRVILRSDKPQAKAFTRWITHEVIPQIRKAGGCSVEQTKIGEEKLTVDQRIKIGESLAQCPLPSLRVLLDVYRPFLLPETFACCKSSPRVPVALPDGGYYSPPKEGKEE